MSNAKKAAPILTLEDAKNRWGDTDERDTLTRWAGYLGTYLGRIDGVTKELLDEVKAMKKALKKGAPKDKEEIVIKMVVMDETDLSFRGRPIIKMKKIATTS